MRGDDKAPRRKLRAATHERRIRCPERLVHGGLGRRGACDVERPHVDAALLERLALLRAELLEVVRGGACVCTGGAGG